jgi:hypothetical protein
MEQGALTPASMIMYQVLTEGAAITAFDLGASHQAIGFGDSGGRSKLSMIRSSLALFLL